MKFFTIKTICLTLFFLTSWHSQSLIKPASAQAELPSQAIPRGCRVIDQVPTVIEAPGHYCLKSNLHYSGQGDAAITIGADNVTIDGAGFCLSGPSGPKTNSYGLLAIDRSGIAVKHLCVKGFRTGLLIGDTANAYMSSPESYHFAASRRSRFVRVMHNSFSRQTFQAIHVRADDVSIISNTIGHVGPTGLYPHAFATAIDVRSNICLVSGNRIMGLHPSGNGEGVGISLYHGRSCIVENNFIDGALKPKFGRIYGIWVRPALGEMPVIRGNVVTSADYAFGPWGYYDNNTAINAACAPFTTRHASSEQKQYAFLHRGKLTEVRTPKGWACSDETAKLKKQALETGHRELAYAVAQSIDDLSVLENRREQLKWFEVSRQLGHEESIRTFNENGLSKTEIAIIASLKEEVFDIVRAMQSVSQGELSRLDLLTADFWLRVSILQPVQQAWDDN